MKLSKEEVVMAYMSLTQTEEGKPMVFPIANLMDASHIAIQLKDKCSENNILKDGEVEFSTNQKALLLRLIERPWGALDGTVYFSLKNKLL